MRDGGRIPAVGSGLAEQIINSILVQGFCVVVVVVVVPVPIATKQTQSSYAPLEARPLFHINGVSVCRERKMGRIIAIRRCYRSIEWYGYQRSQLDYHQPGECILNDIGLGCGVHCVRLDWIGRGDGGSSIASLQRSTSLVSTHSRTK